MSTNGSQVDEITETIARQLHAEHMKCLGIANTMSLAHAYNQRRFGQQDDWRHALYRERIDELLKENGPVAAPPIELHDGWALDTSMSLPHLDRVLADSEKIIAERAGVRITPDGAYRSYFQDVWTPADLERYPSFLDFATSSDIIAAISRYLGCIPALTTTLPSGVRFVESNALFDDQPDTPHDSQLYHIDYYSLPNVYVLVLLQDATSEHGPWTFIPKALSQMARQRLDYWSERRGYRVSDEEIYSVVDRKEVIEFAYPRGSVLFIESSGCFHYGSRNAVKPRFQLMYGYSGVCRTDFSELIMPAKKYPIRPGDSLLRQLVLNKNMAPPGCASS
jgi:hypothetical protein